MKYVKAVLLGIAKMFGIVLGMIALLSVAASFGVLAHFLGASHDVDVLVFCIASLVILGGGIGITEAI